MAICDICDKEMSGTGTSCIGVPVLFTDGSRLPIKYGDEADDWGAASGQNCHDCNCPPGGYHHPGCDVERCPSCGGQLISCDCEGA